MRTVLVTGATGVVGSALVPLLLEDPATRVSLLIRARSPSHLAERVASLLSYWSLPEGAGRVEALAGDACEPLLGLDEATHARLAGEVTHVVHAAGDVRFDRPLDEARRSAVDSVEHILALCRAAAAHGRFVKLEHLSTVGVAGRTSGLVPEAPLPRPRGFHNTYEEAKAEGEDRVLDAASRGLPATVHRPSMVVGEARTGRTIHLQVFAHLAQFLVGARTFGLVPDAGPVRLDLIPSDWVARAILASMARPDAAGRILHLCSGPAFALTANEMGDRLAPLFARHGSPPPPLRRVPLPEFRDALPGLARTADPAARRFLAVLPRLLAYFDEDQVFDNARSRAFFAEAGLLVPPVESYLEAQIEFACRARSAPRREE